jgi:rare lipoprotein A (peptidoglycan hydrolase)
MRGTPVATYCDLPGYPTAYPFPQGRPVMRTWLTVVGLCGLLLMPLLDMADGSYYKIRQVGLSSWYGTHRQGRQTASGERFSRRHLTAAHRSLPLGAKVKVTNLRTKQQVVVKINDCGPYEGGTRRIIDLSEAAKRVGLLERGTEWVEVVVVEHAS